MNTLEINNQLIHFVNNTENPQSNFLLAIEYDRLGHTASAISHYLRCAERTNKIILKYECLLYIYSCFNKQGGRQFTAEYILKQAISLCPERPEAYLLLGNMLYDQGKYYDSYMICSMSLKICDYTSEPLTYYILPYIYPYTLYIKAISGIHWEKVNESNNIFEKLYYEYFNLFDKKTQLSILDKLQNINLLYDHQLHKKVKIIDFFPYFSETGKELLELRINMLKDYVDEFVICESNKTQSGMPLEYTLEKTIKELNLPKNKIKIINLNIPESSDLDIQPIDEMNCITNYDSTDNINTKNIESLRARVRERMQKDALLNVLEDYSDDTIFIHSDSDEIINPKNIEFIISILSQNPDSIISIPLIHLEGKADMRVCYKESGEPKEWYGMFFATKKHLQTNTPTALRSHMTCTLPIAYLVQDGANMKDLGWHFSWMGDFNKRKIKYKAFTHHNDKFSFLAYDYNSKEMEEFQKNLSLEEESMAPSGDTQLILKKIDHKLLPKEIFELPNVKKYLLPE